MVNNLENFVDIKDKPIVANGFAGQRQGGVNYESIIWNG